MKLVTVKGVRLYFFLQNSQVGGGGWTVFLIHVRSPVFCLWFTLIIPVEVKKKMVDLTGLTSKTNLLLSEWFHLLCACVCKWQWGDDDLAQCWPRYRRSSDKIWSVFVCVCVSFPAGQCKSCSQIRSTTRGPIHRDTQPVTDETKGNPQTFPLVPPAKTQSAQ